MNQQAPVGYFVGFGTHCHEPADPYDFKAQRQSFLNRLEGLLEDSERVCIEELRALGIPGSAVGPATARMTDRILSTWVRVVLHAAECWDLPVILVKDTEEFITRRFPCTQHQPVSV